MFKKFALFLALAAAAAALPLRAEPAKPKLSLALRADGLFLTGADWLKDVRTADAELVRGTLGDFHFPISEDYADSAILPGFSAEAALAVSPDITLALGLGCFRKSWSMGGAYDSRALPGPDLWGVSVSHAYSLRVVPLTFEVRLALLTGPFFRLEATSGAGVYFTAFELDQSEEHGFVSSWTGSYNNFKTAESCRDGVRNALGYRFGLRGEVRPPAALALVFEAIVQVVPLGEVRGTLSTSYVQTIDHVVTASAFYDLPDQVVSPGPLGLSGILLRAGLSFGSR